MCRYCPCTSQYADEFSKLTSGRDGWWSKLQNNSEMNKSSKDLIVILRWLVVASIWLLSIGQGLSKITALAHNYYILKLLLWYFWHSRKPRTCMLLRYILALSPRLFMSDIRRSQNLPVCLTYVHDLTILWHNMHLIVRTRFSRFFQHPTLNRWMEPVKRLLKHSLYRKLWLLSAPCYKRILLIERMRPSWFYTLHNEHMRLTGDV